MAEFEDKKSLEDVLRRAAGGDEHAWLEIVEAFSPRVFGLIRSQCNNADLAEEITQSTFCTIVTKLASYTEHGKFEPWLFRIAMNRLRDEMRRRKRQAKPVEDETLRGLAAAGDAGGSRGSGGGSFGGGTSEGGGSIDPEESARLWKAVAQLSEAEQRILHLRHYGELSFKQIADVLDQPLGTVLARQHRALKKLGDILGRPEPDD